MNFFTELGIVVILTIIELLLILLLWFLNSNGRFDNDKVIAPIIIVILICNIIFSWIIVTPNTFGLQKIPTISENSISENNIK